MKIPVFHDDQHGTAIIVGAAVLNGLQVVGKQLGDARLVCSGAGAAALACLDLLVELGLPRSNIFVSDIEGVVYEGRTVLMDAEKARYAQRTSARTLSDVIGEADIFLGLSAGRVLSPQQVARMAPRPLVFALANRRPKSCRGGPLGAQRRGHRDGRSDYPNQVNTCCASRSSSAVRSTSAPPRSRARWKWRRCTQSRGLRVKRAAMWQPAPTAPRSPCSGPST